MDQVYFRSGIEIKRISYGVLGLVLAAHAGLPLALTSYQKELLLPVEQPILISLIAPADASKPEMALKPEPVLPKPVKPIIKPAQKPVMPQAPREPEPQLVTRAAEDTLIATAEQKPMVPAVESAPEQQPEPAKVAAVLPREESPIEQPRFNADYLNNPAPAYPTLSRKLREKGRVLLRVLVDINGHPSQVTFHESSGFSRLDERAAETVRRWKFVPARQGGQPVEAWVIVPIQFNLKG